MCGQDARKACLVPKTCRHPLLSARPRKGKMNKDRKPIHQGIYFALTLLWVKQERVNGVTVVARLRLKGRFEGISVSVF